MNRVSRSIVLILSLMIAAVTHAAPQDTQSQKITRSKKISEAKRLVHMGRPELALERLRLLLEEDNDDLAALDALGWVYMEMGRIEEAEKTFRHILTLDDKNRSAFRNLGKMQFDLGNVEEAVRVWEELIENDPKNPAAYRFIGGLEMGFELFDQAEALYRRGREACGSETLFASELARLAILLGKTTVALEEYLLQIRENRAAYVVVRQQILKLAEETEEAAVVEEELREHLTDRDIAPEVWGILSHLRLDAGDYAAAREAMRQRLSQRKPSSREQIDFARACLEERDLWGRPVEESREIAAEILTDLFRSGGKDHHVPSAGLLLAGLYLDRLERLSHGRSSQDAEEWMSISEATLNQMIDRYAGTYFGIQAHLLKGRLLFRHMHDPAAAYDYYMTFVDQSSPGPETSQAVREAGRCLLALGDYKTARDHFQGLAYSPGELDQGTAAYYLALIDFLEGKTEDAFKGFTEFAESYPHLPEANDALETAWVLQRARQENEKLVEVLVELEKTRLAYEVEDTIRLLTQVVADYREAFVRAKALRAKGDLECGAGEFDQALVTYRTLLEDYPDHRLAPVAMQGMAEIYLDGLDDPKKALFEYEMILSRYPDYLFLDEVRERVRILQDYLARLETEEAGAEVDGP